AAIKSGDGLDSGLFRGSAKGVEQVPAHPRRLDMPFAADAMRGALAHEMIFVAPEKRQHIVPAPAVEPELPPMIVVRRLAAHIDHGVDRRRAADHLAAWIVQAAAVQAGLRLGLETPIRTRVADCEQ